jgi:ABC-type lipoprotein release transport system permease subunit
MALEPGRGRTAVPVRSTIFGASLSLIALAAALSFGASLDHLVTTPGLAGWNWDLATVPKKVSQDAHEQRAFRQILDRDSAVAGYATGGLFQFTVGRTVVFGLAMTSQKGSVAPSLIEGRVPRSANEIALGTETMRSEAVAIGDTVIVRGKGGEPADMRVVGRIAMPSFPYSFSREGAMVSVDGATRITGTRGNNWLTFVRFRPGASREDVLPDLKRRVGPLFEFHRQESSQIDSLGGVGNVPLVLAGIIALLATVTMAHTLVTSIRRRRLDLAILKTLGFVRRQVSAAVAWQASTLASVALLIGLPLGVMGGRWGWNVFADRLGVVPDPIVPAVTILLIAPAAVLIANLIAVLPGRIASRLRPAPVLRTE